MVESKTPPNSAAANQSGFAVGDAALQQDDLFALHQSSPARRHQEYNSMCKEVIRRMPDRDPSIVVPFATTLATMFHQHAPEDDELYGIFLALLLDPARSRFMQLVQHALHESARHLPAHVLQDVFQLQRSDDDDQAMLYQLHPAQPSAIVHDRIKQSLGSLGHPPCAPPECLELLIPLVFRPAPPPAALEVEHRAQQVQRAFSTTFLGPAVDRLVFHLGVHSRHSFTTHAPSKNSSVQPSTDQQPTLPYFARVIPILQSSGFGKTKMCVHLGAKHPGLLLCLRHDTPNESVSFPPQDSLVYGYMQACLDAVAKPDKAKTGDEDRVVHFRLANFLAAYCTTLKLYLARLMHLSGCCHSFAHSSQPKGQASTNQHPLPSSSLCWKTVVFVLSTSLKRGFLENLALDPPKRFCPHVATFCHLNLLPRSQVDQGGTSVNLYPQSLHLELSQAQTDFVSLLTAHNARKKIISEILAFANAANAEPMPKPQAVEAAPAQMARNIIRPALLELERLVETDQLDEEVIFYLALDECGSIEPLLPHVRRLWNYAEPKRTWIFLIDTNSKISPVAGRAASAASGRTDLFTGTHQLPIPFTALPLDVHPTRHEAIQLCKDIEAGHCSLRRLNLMIPKLGRPLWNDSELFRDRDYMLRCHAIIGKLVGSTSQRWPDKLPKPSQPLDSAAFQPIMALVLQRVPMGYSCLSEQVTWQEFVKNQVSYHLRFIEKVLPNSNVVKSHVVSEPPLSVAAAWSFRHEPSKIGLKWSTAIMTLASARAAVGLQVGLEGEEGAHLICSMASDFAAGEAYKDDFLQVGFDDAFPDRYACTMGLVRLDRWLDILIGNEYDPRVPAADPKQAPLYSPQVSKDFRAWCKSQWLNFKHVAALPKQVKMSKTLDRNLLAHFWLRHAAMRGPANQEGWDLLIPLYNSESVPIGDEPFQINQLSFVAIQVKNELYSPNFPDPLGPTLSAVNIADVNLGECKHQQQHQHEHQQEPAPQGQEQEQGQVALTSSSSTTTLELYLDLRGPSRTPSLLKMSAPRASKPKQEDHQEQQQQTRYNIYVSGLDAERYPVLGRLEGDARGLMPTMFGLSYLGTNRFETDFIDAVHSLDNQGREQARRQLHELGGFMPMFDGIPTQGEEPWCPKPFYRGYAIGQSKRMRAE
ncbi:hypothetical protein EX895_001187 [Sporisorium graminicola]|uniref:Uncharacterized protein n=1 Tax=Sporisorium graminicola TaxID=280036 RepID=A0A4U7KZ97_9BASI|nr:hypothetical protein EX895_001187 [Sporisorium graminicola]TKY89890.1 hypothetical protein EX895_001187 [Sporisorium graminicola]